MENEGAIRVNTLKISAGELRKRLSGQFKLRKIPWFDGFYYEGDGIGSTLEYKLGYYYVQEAASMLPPLALQPGSGDTVLDLCASPGSKTTQMSQMMGNEGMIVANDVRKRITALASNIQRCGCVNTVAVSHDGRRFPLENFDRALVDAPCTASGSERIENKLRGIIRLQKALVTSAYDRLGAGGELVYSTCSRAVEENEEVVAHLLAERDAEPAKVRIKRLKTDTGVNEEKYPFAPKCLRHDNFFIAKVMKP